MINKLVENIVIGKPIVDVDSMFSTDYDNWLDVERFKTIWIDERDLATILTSEIPIKHIDNDGNLVEDTINFNVFKSRTQLRKNRPDLLKKLDSLDFLELKIGKRKFWVLVGE